MNLFSWDMNVETYADPSINTMIRKLQPNGVINHRGMDEGDYGTPEREWDPNGGTLAYDTPVEACTSVGLQSWGYRIDESYDTDRHLLRNIDRYIAKGGNFLLNVGPRPDGVIPDRAADILRRIGDWIKPVREALYDVIPASAMTQNREVLLTRRENTLYVHLVKDPMGEDVILRPLHDLPKKATLLNDGRALRVANDMVPWQHMEQRGYLRIQGVPVHAYANSVIVIKRAFEHLDDDVAAKAETGTDENIM